MLFLEGDEGRLIFTAFWWPIRQSPRFWGASGRSNESSPLMSSYEEPRYRFQNIAASPREMRWAARKLPWATSVSSTRLATAARSRFLRHIWHWFLLASWALVAVALQHDKISSTGCCAPGWSFCTPHLEADAVWWDPSGEWYIVGFGGIYPAGVRSNVHRAGIFQRRASHSQLLVPVGWKKIINLKL